MGIDTQITIENELGVDIRGMSPGRARYAIHNARKKAVKEKLVNLRAGYSRLESDIGKANAAKAELEALIASDARSLVDKIKAGIDWALAQFGSQPVEDLSSRLAASTHHAAVAAAALAATEREIAQAEADLTALEAKTQEITGLALQEAAEGIYADYTATLHELYETVVQLLALEKVSGVQRFGRTVMILPDFEGRTGLPEQPIAINPADVSEAWSAWKSFARALEQDPRTPISALKFPPCKLGGRGQNLTYEEMHPLERRIVDIRRASGE